MISQRTAHDLWIAYDEIAKAEKLLAEMESQRKNGENPNPRDAMGRRKNLSLGVPTGENSRQLFDVSPVLADTIIRAHIAEKKAVLVTLNNLARIESAESGVEA